MIDLLIIILSYFIGSLTWGIIITKYIKKRDIREKDFAGSAGVSRQFGILTGVTVGILDGLKGILVIFLATTFGKTDLTIILSYIAMILGNNFPIYFNFKGGQGLAATLGAAIYVFPIETIISVIVAICFIFLYVLLKLDRFIKFMGPIPFGAVFGFITMFIIVVNKYPFYPYQLLIIVAALLLLSRGLMMISYHKKRRN